MVTLTDNSVYIIGVGSGLSPPQWLKPGDQVEVNITKIGTLRNGVVYA